MIVLVWFIFSCGKKTLNDLSHGKQRVLFPREPQCSPGGTKHIKCLFSTVKKVRKLTFRAFGLPQSKGYQLFNFVTLSTQLIKPNYDVFVW